MGIAVEHGPGEAMGIWSGLGIWRGFEGELTMRPTPGDGDGFRLGGREGGDARLKDVAGLEP